MRLILKYVIIVYGYRPPSLFPNRIANPCFSMPNTP